jgi:ketosteroid isomerase-like protein
MSSKALTQDQSEIARIIQRINDSWLSKSYDEIGNHLADGVILAPPGSANRIRGRQAYVQSYRDYDSAAKTHSFQPSEPVIDVIGDIAIAVTPFSITYEMQGVIHNEKGEELLVFSRDSGNWRIIWRSMRSDPAS